MMREREDMVGVDSASGQVTLTRNRLGGYEIGRGHGGGGHGGGRGGRGRGARGGGAFGVTSYDYGPAYLIDEDDEKPVVVVLQK